MAPRFVAGERLPRPPTQARSIASQERLLDAAQRLFGEQGYDETSVAEIVSEAHASVGVFYNRFVDKAEVFRAVVHRVLERVLAMWAEALDRGRRPGAGLAEVVAEVVRDLAQFLRANGPMLRAISMRNISDPAVVVISRGVSGLLVAPLAELLLQHRAEISHPNPELAVDLGFQMLYATLRQTVLYGDERPTELAMSWEELVAELSRAYVAYLKAT